jgi:protocatechuate 3,4-dioxygenase beta subunit
MFRRDNTAVKKLAPTPAVEEGPYYKEGSPGRRNIADPTMPGTSFILEGKVKDTSGKPIANAWMDFWQADSTGQYDNTNFKLRGHQYTEKDGKYRLETVMPEGYESRAPHIHVKVRAAENSPVLTTQLFFAGNEKNATDLIFEELTVMFPKKDRDGQKATFDFIVDTQ